jgi:oxygen-independent coproporphyrinogen-3 oxidase
MEVKMKSLYIHIPFCKQKCLYCDFNSFADKDKLIDDYIKKLIEEIESNNIKKLDTIYIGGGTPSYINEIYIKQILEKLPKAEETTIEVNPGTITENKIKTYLNSGINRISIGLQATQDEILKLIGRIHTLKEFEDTFNMVRKYGFKNINVDLMFGLPNQTLENLKESVNYLIKLNPEHISCYSLITHNNIFKNLPDEETERNMYYYIIKVLKENGYLHYEISNFAKEGKESKHNLVYWNQNEYLGVGAGASSYIKDTRWTNESDIKKYISSPFSKNIEEVQNEESKLNEYIILQLRLIKGININDTFKKFKVNILEKYKTNIDKLNKLGLIEISENIKLTSKGLDLANIVWEEFI